MRLVLGFIKKKYNQYYSKTTIKSISHRVNRFNKTPEPLKLRVRKFLRVVGLIFFFIKSLRKTTAQIAIIDNFISDDNQSFRTDFISHFKPEYKISDFAFLNGKTFFYKKLSLKKLTEALIIWVEWSWIAFIAIFRTKDNYGWIHFDNIAGNLINLVLLEPKESYVFQFYSPTSYITTLIGQVKSELFISASSSLLYTGSRYGTLPDATMLFCWDYHFEEYQSFSELGWLTTKNQILWGPEEIIQHSQVIPEAPKYDVGIYSRGDWGRDNLLKRITDIDKLRTIEKASNQHARFFREIIKTLGEINPSLRMKIYPHPFERDLYNQYKIKPAYADLAEKYDIEIDLSSGNSIDKIYECKIGIGNITSIIMDRWGHGLKAFAAYNKELDKDFCAPHYLGKYKDCFFVNEEELQILVEKEVL